MPVLRRRRHSRFTVEPIQAPPPNEPRHDLHQRSRNAQGRSCGAIAVTALAAAALTAAVVGTGPDTGAAADHVDAPGLTPPGGNFQLDVTDVYAWRAKTGNTVLAVNVNGLTKKGQKPVFASGVPSVGKTKGVAYWLRVDNSGDAVADVDLKIEFTKPNAKGVQLMKVSRNGKQLVSGKTSPGNAVTINGRTA